MICGVSGVFAFGGARCFLMSREANPDAARDLVDLLEQA